MCVTPQTPNPGAGRPPPPNSHGESPLYPLQLESERLLSVVPVDVALYHRGEYALYRQAKAEGMAL
jgi:hypothetical protein